MTLQTRRKFTNRVALTLSLAAMAFGLFWLGCILWQVMYLGIGGISVDLFTKMTPAPGSEGGLLNAIVGSVILVVLFVWAFIGTMVGRMQQMAKSPKT